LNVPESQTLAHERQEKPDKGKNMKNFSPMTTFDKICAALSISIGAIFMVLGVIGLFIGAKAYFTLPPILGVLPFFLGWGMCVPLVKYWRMSGKDPDANQNGWDYRSEGQ
jgi:hypothetical protein